jgi:three-Cys-motif partner protein
MEQYLLPTDDGLSMRSSGLWVIEKLDYLRRYLYIFVTAMRQKWPYMNYIDLFAGPGKCSVRENNSVHLSSPLLALTAGFPLRAIFLLIWIQAT